MQFFIDTAFVEEIWQAQEMGMVDGVTTNPSLVAKTGRDFHEVLEEICRLVSGPVSAEVLALNVEAMVNEARALAKIAPNIVVKIPLIVEGLKAVRRLREEGIQTNVTLCFSPSQALLAAKAGADYISPFIGRLDDISTDGMELVEQIRTIYDHYDFQTRIIVASIRHPMHVVEAALIGADVATIPFAVIQKLAHHPLTDIGLKRFLDDWEKAKQAQTKK